MRPAPRTTRSTALLLAGITGSLLATACNTSDTALTEPATPEVAAPAATFGLFNIAPRLISIFTSTPELLATVSTPNGDVNVTKSGYGSGMARVPYTLRDFYLLTDRGPNIDGPGSPAPKRFPDPTYAPRIYRVQALGGKLRFQKEIVLKRPDGVTPLTGLPISAGVCGSTLETAQTIEGTPIAPDDFGLDPEGIVAMPDGTFWLSDEYGPFISHYDRNGRELERLSPCNGGLPSVYQLRRPNRGMEGLTSTPDGRWLVGIMQSPLNNPSTAGVQNVSRATRVLFRNIKSGETKEYLYLLDRANLQGNSEILAISNTRFLVIERDGNFLGQSPAATLKYIYEFDMSKATDISALGAMGATPINGKTIEQATVEELESAGIRAVTKSLRVDLLALGYPHDKPEGMAFGPGGMLFVINDDDFGINQIGGVLQQKLLTPTGPQDAPALWQIWAR